MKKLRFISIGLMLPIVTMTSCKKVECMQCECQNGLEETIITCTQVYYPTDDCHIFYYLGGHFYEQNKTNDTNHNGYAMHSGIWTFGGIPGIIRFFLFFDLFDYNNTEKTLIENTSLYLYGHPTYMGHSSNTPTNRHVFNRVVDDWDETTITWNNQPNVDETTSIITDHIPGTMNNPSRSDYIFNLNDILLENGKLRADYKGISCRPYQENVNDYYRQVTFATRESGFKELLPTLKIEYALHLPKIIFENKIFSVTSNEDLKALFNVQYVWTINGEINTGESVCFERTTNRYIVHLQIIITNNIGEITQYCISRTF